MDMSQLQRLDEWVRTEFGERVSRDDLVAKSDGAELPQEVELVLTELPDGEWPKEEALGKLHEIAHDRYGAGLGTTMAGKEGGGGVFGE